MTPPVPLAQLREDLLAEQAALDVVVGALSADDWAAPTPSPGWTVTDQIAHLTYFDDAAVRAITAPETWPEHLEPLLGALAAGDVASLEAQTLDPLNALPVDRRADAWRDARRRLADAAATLRGDERVPWYGPSMSARSFLTARLMECWAHGQDVVDAVGAHREPTDRLRHIAQLGVITRGWSYANRGETVPAEEVHVDLGAPSGARWVWGPVDASNRIVGPAEHFCLVVTQRRDLVDTELDVTGPAAVDWMSKAQAFAGPPTQRQRRSH